MTLELARPLPDPNRVSALLARYVRAPMSADVGSLSAGDRAAFPKLVEAARSIDAIYWRQRSDHGLELLNAARRFAQREEGELERLLRVNFGPWDNLNADTPFWEGSPLPPGANFYPPDLTRAELARYLELHPEEKARLLEPTNLVRRRDGRLTAIPYARAYEGELQCVAASLSAASTTVSDESFQRFLKRRAEDLTSGDLYESEKLWVGAAKSPLDMVIGPYEVYDDAFQGVKTSYEAAILVRHPLSARIAEFEGMAAELGSQLPGAISDDPVERKVSIGVYDLAYAAGLLNMGSKAIAVMLPNDENVRRDAGTRLLLFRNVIDAKFDSILTPLAARILARDDLELVQREAFLFQTLLHEAGHALGSGFVQQAGRRTDLTIRQALAERYSTIEEARAELLGLHFLSLLARRGVLPTELRVSGPTTFVMHSARAVRFGAKSDHARAAALSLSYLCEQRAIRREGEWLRVDPEQTERAVAALAARVQAIASSGDYDAAGRLLDHYGSIPSEFADLAARSENVPVDLEYAFDISSALRG